MELCSMLCGSPNGRGVWGRMDTCICMAEFTTHLKLSQRCLLVSYTSLQNKKFKKAKKKKETTNPKGFSSAPSCKECRRHKIRFNPWVGKIPWRRAWQPPSILSWRIPWTAEPGRATVHGVEKSRTRLKQLSTQPKDRYGIDSVKMAVTDTLENAVLFL